ncbi:hypothetical protein B0H14DRAFT_2359376 [Mycena olivaceomarginata]|nr:hypothetical protein B0H14DRAFT_2359376 [Mycena olivaceomarginata]
MRITAQEDEIDLPVYGTGDVVAGTIEVTKTENISSVDVTVEGRVKVHELGEGGRTEATISVGPVKLWIKADDNAVCPSSLSFSVMLPTTFQEEGRSYPLPPSHFAHLEGVPGFDANINVSVQRSLVVSCIRTIPTKVEISFGTLSTPFIYQPRSRPAHPIPAPLDCNNAGFIARPEWKMYSSVVKAHPNERGLQDIVVKFYIPKSRIFWVGEAIPFHITFEGTSDSLAGFMPYRPTGELNITRFQLIRQSCADVRHADFLRTVVHNIKTNRWRRDCFGEGVFRPAAEGATWMSFSGEIPIEPITVTGFQLRHFSVTDWLTVTPPTKSPFVGIRKAIPVKLTTDPWVEDDHRLNPLPPPPAET